MVRTHFAGVAAGDARVAPHVPRVLNTQRRHGVARQIGVPRWNLITPIPSGKPDVCVVDAALVEKFNQARLWSALKPEADPRPEAEGLVTNLRDVALGVVSADCIPMLAFDSQAGVVGAAHVSRALLGQGIVQRTMEGMRNLGAKDIQVYMGPCLQRDNHLLDVAATDALLSAMPEAASYLRKAEDSKWRFDFSACAAAVVEDAGAHVAHRSDVCTLGDPAYFSHRAAQQGLRTKGLNLSLIARRG